MNAATLHPHERIATLEQSPHVVLHIDADGFFATCEQAIHPELRGKPVVTGLERGIVSAASYEAKRMGVKRGVSLSEARVLCPNAIFLPSDYELYSLMSKRMFAIVRRFAPLVEEYSIDEAFVDITGHHKQFGGSYKELAARMQRAVEGELGISISIGIAQTKVLAKVATNWNKPHGLTLIHPPQVPEYLAQWPIEKLWGIGTRIGRRLRSRGIGTALQLYNAPKGFIEQFLFKPQQEMWHELHGTPIYNVNQELKSSYDSINNTRTFTPPSSNRDYIFAQLSKNLENACIKARRYNLATTHIAIFLKRQNFTYSAADGSTAEASAYPVDMIRTLETLFDSIYEPGVLYRATGVTLFNLQPYRPHQLSLFTQTDAFDEHAALYTQIDALAGRFGKHTVFLGSTLQVMSALDERMEHRRRGATIGGNSSNTLRANNIQQQNVSMQRAQAKHTQQRGRQTQKPATSYARRFVNIPIAGSTQ